MKIVSYSKHLRDMLKIEALNDCWTEFPLKMSAAVRSVTSTTVGHLLG